VRTEFIDKEGRGKPHKKADHEIAQSIDP